MTPVFRPVVLVMAPGVTSVAVGNRETDAGNATVLLSLMCGRGVSSLCEYNMYAYLLNIRAFFIVLLILQHFCIVDYGTGGNPIQWAFS